MMTRVAVRFWSELLTSDPGLLRLRSASRTTLGVALAAAILGELARLGTVSALAVATGVVFAMMAGSLPREPALRERLRTVAAMAVSGALATVVTTLLAPVPYLGEAAFLVLLFGAVAFQSRGPRAVACGLGAVVDSYLTLFLHADVAHLPTALLSFPIAAAVVVLVKLAVLPERPREALLRIIRTVERRGATLLHAIEAAEAADRPAALVRRRLFADLTDTILAAEDQLAVVAPGRSGRLSATLLKLELALTQVATAAMTARPLARGERARIRLTAMRLHASRWSDLRRRPGNPTPLLVALREVESAASLLAETALPDLLAPDPSGQRAAGPPAGTKRAALSWRPAARAGIAALLSMIGGHLISPDRWFWAVLTAYLLFLGARSRGDTVFKGVQRLWGSLIGLVVGVLVSVALSGWPTVEGAGILACVFGLTYTFVVSPVVAIFCVTVLLGLVYSLLGVPAEKVLILRLEETAIGAAAAMAVGLFVLPKRTHDLVSENGNQLLATLAEVVRLSGRRFAGDPEADPVAAMRRADRHFRDMRAAVRPLQAGSALAWRARAPAELPAIVTCMLWVRTLAIGSGVAAALSDEAGGAVKSEAERIADALDGLARPDLGVAAELEEGAAVPARDPDPTSALLLGALANLRATVAVLSDRLAGEGWTALVSRRPI